MEGRKMKYKISSIVSLICCCVINLANPIASGHPLIVKPFFIGCAAGLLLQSGCTLQSSDSILYEEQNPFVSNSAQQVSDPIVLDGHLFSYPSKGVFYTDEEIDRVGGWQVVADGGLNCRVTPGVPAKSPGGNILIGAMPQNTTFLYGIPLQGNEIEMEKVWLHNSYWVKVQPNILEASNGGEFARPSCFVNAHSAFIKPIVTKVFDSAHEDIQGACQKSAVELRYETPEYHLHICRFESQETVTLKDADTGKTRYYAEKRPLLIRDYEEGMDLKTVIEDEPFTLKVAEKAQGVPLGRMEIEYHESTSAPLSQPILRQYRSN